MSVRIDPETGRPEVGITRETSEAVKQVHLLATLAVGTTSPDAVEEAIQELSRGHATMPIFDPTAYMHGGMDLMTGNERLLSAFLRFRAVAAEVLPKLAHATRRRTP